MMPVQAQNDHGKDPLIELFRPAQTIDYVELQKTTETEEDLF